jgi:hypothetical protein
MKYFKDGLGNINAYLADGSQDEFIPANLIPISEYEVAAIQKSKVKILTAAEKRALLSPLSAWQIRKVLTKSGLRTQVEAAILLADQNTQDAWHYASEFRRDDAILNAMAVTLGITATQLDDLFTLGVTL